jgi:hypothetical protein
MRLSIEDELATAEQRIGHLAVERGLVRNAEANVAAPVATARGQVQHGQRRSHTHRAGDELTSIDIQLPRPVVAVAQDLGTDAPLLAGDTEPNRGRTPVTGMVSEAH